VKLTAAQEARVDFELEMAEYYEAAGLDHYAERSRAIAAELTEAYQYSADPTPDPVPLVPPSVGAEPELEAGPVSAWEATESAPGGAPITYITEVWSPAPDDGAIRTHSRMPDPEPLPDLEPEPEIEP
jgi:hypothetical protein